MADLLDTVSEVNEAAFRAGQDSVLALLREPDEELVREAAKAKNLYLKRPSRVEIVKMYVSVKAILHALEARLKEEGQ